VSPLAGFFIWVALSAYAYYVLVYLPEQERKELHASLEMASTDVGTHCGTPPVSNPSPEPARLAQVQPGAGDQARAEAGDQGCPCPCCSQHRGLRKKGVVWVAPGRFVSVN